MSRKDALIHYFNMVENGELNETKNTRAAYMAGYNYGVQVKMGKVRDKLRQKKPTTVDDDAGFSLALAREDVDNPFMGATKVVIDNFDAMDLGEAWSNSVFTSVKDIAYELIAEMPELEANYPLSVFLRAADALVQNGKLRITEGDEAVWNR